MLRILCIAIRLYYVVFIGRIIFSWFPLGEESRFKPVEVWCLRLTEWILAPLRRVIPPIGGFDISIIIPLIVLQMISQGILGCGGLV